MKIFLRVLLVAIPGVGTLTGCQFREDSCNPHVHRNESFSVNVIRPVDFTVAAPPGMDPPPSSWRDLPSCGLDDVHDGDRYTITLSDKFEWNNTEPKCYFFICPLDFPTPATRLNGELYPEGGPANVCFNVHGKVDLGSGCELARDVALYSVLGYRDLYAAPEGGAPHPIILRRGLFTYPNVTCPDLGQRFPDASPDQGMVCMDLWEVSLERR